MIIPYFQCSCFGEIAHVKNEYEKKKTLNQLFAEP
jgi:hypothetical protein